MISSVIFFLLMNYVFAWYDIYYFLILLIKTSSNISIDSSSVNIFSSLLPHLPQIIERTNVLPKIYDIVGFLDLLYLLT